MMASKVFRWRGKKLELISFVGMLFEAREIKISYLKHSAEKIKLYLCC